MTLDAHSLLFCCSGANSETCTFRNMYIYLLYRISPDKDRSWRTLFTRFQNIPEFGLIGQGNFILAFALDYFFVSKQNKNPTTVACSPLPTTVRALYFVSQEYFIPLFLLRLAGSCTYPRYVLLEV